MKRLLPLALLAVVLIFGAMYFTSSMASLDAGTDVQGSEYETVYDDTTENSVTSLGIISLIAYIIGVAALVSAIFMMRKVSP